MTAPGLYRYFGSREDLVRNVVSDIFTEVAEGPRPRDPYRRTADWQRNGARERR